MSQNRIETHGFVTVLSGPDRLNKKVTRINGHDYLKEPGPAIEEARAKVFAVPTAQSMARVLRNVAARAEWVLMAGFFPDVEPSTNGHDGACFLVLSRTRLSRYTGIPVDSPELLGWHWIDYAGKRQRAIARLKANTLPSIWDLIDRDTIRGMPEHLASMSESEFLGAYARLLPGFEHAPLIREPSTTGRVLMDGVPLEASGCHYWTMLADPTDRERAGQAVLFRGFQTDPPLSFMRPKFSRENPTEIVSHVPWSIADPTTHSRERLVYAGAPTVEGPGLSVASPVVEILREDGVPIDTSTLELPEPAAVHAELRGHKLGARKDDAGHVVGFVITERSLLQLDTVVETQFYGPMTVEEFWDSDHQHVRCQTPFRDSQSWNGFLGRHSDGVPFCVDNGLRCKYLLPRSVVALREFRDLGIQIGPDATGTSAEDGTESQDTPRGEEEGPQPPRDAEACHEALSIARALVDPAPVLRLESPTGSGKTFELCRRAHQDILEGAFPIVVLGSKRELDSFEAEYIKANNRTLEDDGVQIFRRDGVRVAEEGEQSGKTQGIRIAGGKGALTHYWYMGLRRGDSMEWPKPVRDIVRIKAAKDDDDLDEEEREFQGKPLRIYVDEAGAFVAALVRILELDRRTWRENPRGAPQAATRSAQKCPRDMGRTDCRSCTLHPNALAGRINAHHVHELTALRLPGSPSDTEYRCDADRVLEQAAQVTPALDAGSFAWGDVTPKSPETPATLKGFERKLKWDETHDQDQILASLLATSWRGRIVTHHAIYEGKALSQAEVLRILEAADKATKYALARSKGYTGSAGKPTEEEWALAAKKDGILYPTYPCDVRYLMLPDWAPLSFLRRYGDRVRLLGATFPEWGDDLLAHAWEQTVPVVRIPSAERLMDAVLVVDVQFELKASQLERLAKIAEEVGTLVLIFAGLKERSERFAMEHQKAGLSAFHEGATKSVLQTPGYSETAEGSAGTCTYVASALSQGANLGKFKVAVIDSQTYSPTHSLVLPETFGEDDVQQAARQLRIHRMIQPAGRILRPHAEGPQRRIVICHNPDIEWAEDPETARPKPMPVPVPAEVVRAIAQRTSRDGARSNLRVIRVSHSFSYLGEAIREFLATGRVSQAEPHKTREKQSKAQRARGVRSQPTREERRWGVREALRQYRDQGKSWYQACRSKGVQSPMANYFSAEERRILAKLYRDGAALEL